LKNSRPISLLNVEYKIAPASISARIKSVLTKLISEDQSGFIPGRFIGDNIRLVYDIMYYTERINIPGMILLLDFATAFDSLSWKFMHNVLELFNLVLILFYGLSCSTQTLSLMSLLMVLYQTGFTFIVDADKVTSYLLIYLFYVLRFYQFLSNIMTVSRVSKLILRNSYYHNMLMIPPFYWMAQKTH